MKKKSDYLKPKAPKKISSQENRRHFLKGMARIITGSALGLGIFSLVRRNQYLAWQLDPQKCVQCGQCANKCVLTPSAVKCVHAFSICGYCKLCGGYHQPGTQSLNTAAENQLCPTGAIKRAFIEEPFYEYQIDEQLCIGCGKCVKGCTSFGNGSLYLQVRQQICTQCNECSIARHCPAQAFRQVPMIHPYITKNPEGT